MSWPTSPPVWVGNCAQIDRVPECSDAIDQMIWDKHGLPLLFKGTDFSQTDIACVIKR